MQCIQCFMPTPNPIISHGGMLKIAIAILTIAYPIIIFFSVGTFEPRWIGLLVLVVAGARLLLSRSPSSYLFFLIASILLTLTWWSGAWLPLKLYPVAVNMSLLAIFGTSILFPPSIVERIARKTHQNLSMEGVKYTRRVTKIWCWFFVGNGLVALYTALYSSDEIWMAYNSCVAYLLMGVIAATEWIVRPRDVSQPGNSSNL